MKAVKVTNAMSQMGYYPRDTEVELSCDIPFLTEPIPHSSYCLANGMWSESYCSRGPGDTNGSFIYIAFYWRCGFKVSVAPTRKTAMEE